MTDSTQTLKLRYLLGDLDEAEARFQLLGVPFMALGADGLGRSPDIEGTLGEVVFWLEDADQAAALLEGAKAGMPPLVSWDQADLVTVNWVEHWRRYFHWTAVSETLAVGPPWEPPPDRETLIRIDPGESFGTGTHPTTRLSLGLLEEVVAGRKTPSVLDVGCGSGVLCVAARLLGAGEVLGVEVDEASLDECARNALINEAQFRASLVPLAEIEGAWDIVVANILPHILIALAPALVARVAPGGTLLLSGVPTRDETFPQRFGDAAGTSLRLVDARTLDEWWAGVFMLGAP
jgi:ribosomal protein L11 methyltransferase